MDWYQAIGALRSGRKPAVLVSLVEARGHTPRAAGAKMVVSAERVWDSIGGGNLEATAVSRARAMLQGDSRSPESISLRLNDKAPAEHGKQCCGGEVTIVLDPLPVVPSVAIFGMGHVGWELARILDRHAMDLHLIDSRPGQLDAELLARLDGVAHVHPHQSPVPELVLGEVPKGTHVLIMTHDHGEDAALVDSALRHLHLGSIGLIGSAAKWQRFRKRLLAEGHGEGDLRRVTTPIGFPEVGGKEPAVIAVSVAAAMLQQVAAGSMRGTRSAPAAAE